MFFFVFFNKTTLVDPVKQDETKEKKQHLKLTLRQTPVWTTTTLPCTYICHKHRVAQSTSLQSVDDLGWEVRVVCNRRRDTHPSVSHVLSPSSLLASSHSLQHSARMFPIWVLQGNRSPHTHKIYQHIKQENVLDNPYICFSRCTTDDYKFSTSLMLSGLPLRSCLFIVSIAFFTNCSSLNSTTLWKEIQVPFRFTHRITLMTIIHEFQK